MSIQFGCKEHACLRAADCAYRGPNGEFCWEIAGFPTLPSRTKYCYGITGFYTGKHVGKREKTELGT